MADLNKLSKKKLEEMGREHGIELDRRKTKATLVSELREVVGDETPAAAVDPTLLTEVKQPIPTGLLTGPDGSILVFDDLGKARGRAHKKGGRTVEFNGGWAIKIY